MQEFVMSLTGQCLCGAIRYQIESVPAMSGVCHCKNCQRQAGSAFSILAAVPKSEFSFNSGEPKLYEDSDTHNGNMVERWFCGTCGSPIYTVVDSQPDTVYLRAGTMDDTSSLQPQFQVWCDSKQNWVSLVEGVPVVAKQT